MKAFIRINEHAWLDPERIDALVTVPAGVLVLLASGEHITLPGTDVETVMDTIETAYIEAEPAT